MMRRLLITCASALTFGSFLISGNAVRAQTVLSQCQGETLQCLNQIDWLIDNRYQHYITNEQLFQRRWNNLLTLCRQGNQRACTEVQRQAEAWESTATIRQSLEMRRRNRLDSLSK